MLRTIFNNFKYFFKNTTWDCYVRALEEITFKKLLRIFQCIFVFLHDFLIYIMLYLRKYYRYLNNLNYYVF
jgi:hypothetical protein